MKSITRNRLYNSVLASFIEIDFNNIDNTNIQIKKQLSSEKKELKESFYRDNSKDKFELKN